MTFTTVPNDYASFRGPLNYAFTLDGEARDVVVRIFDADTNTVIGRKQLYGITSAEIDIAPYIRQRLQPQLPPAIASTMLISLPMQTSVLVEVEGVASPSRTFIASEIDTSQPFCLLSGQMLSRTMTRDEFDIVSLYFSPEVEAEVVVEFFGQEHEMLAFTPSEAGICSVVVTARRAAEGVQKVRLTAYVDDATACEIIYTLRPNLPTARRLAWLNHYFAPEFYTFPLRKGVLIKATRKCMENMWGREAAALESENELKLISAYEPRAQIEALCGILSSPKVWLAEGNALEQVELLTDRILTAPCAQMGMVEVDIRAAEEGVRLW